MTLFFFVLFSETDLEKQVRLGEITTFQAMKMAEQRKKKNEINDENFEEGEMFDSEKESGNPCLENFFTLPSQKNCRFFVGFVNSLKTLFFTLLISNFKFCAFRSLKNQILWKVRTGFLGSQFSLIFLKDQKNPEKSIVFCFDHINPKQNALDKIKKKIVFHFGPKMTPVRIFHKKQNFTLFQISNGHKIVQEFLTGKKFFSKIGQCTYI